MPARPPHRVSPVAAPLARSLRRRLLRWFRVARRDLPWRRTRDPYAIWISEVLLQQTRVDTAIPYYERFLARFPDPASLAAAEEDEVLAAWSGLGYYRRARALREAARALVERHGGVFPSVREEALALPGVGPYTAGAVLSIAFDRPEPLVDGNVERVLGRLFAVDTAHGSRARRERMWGLAAALVPRRGGAGEWNQALMELGASLCAPRRPACDACPVAEDCAARAAGRQEELPPARMRAPSLAVAVEALLVRRGGRVLLERRPAGGRMAGMWQLPTRQSSGAARLFPAAHGMPGLRAGAELARAPHTITRHRIAAVLRAGRLASGARVAPPFAWHGEGELAGLPLNGLSRKLLLAPLRVDPRGGTVLIRAGAPCGRRGHSLPSRRRP